MNKAILSGRLTRDPQLNKTNTGKSVTRIILAVDRNTKDENGQREADFMPVIVWGSTGEYLAKNSKKGTNILVEGKFQTRDYDGKDGNKHYVTEVIAQRIEIYNNTCHNKEKTTLPEKVWESLSNVPVEKDKDGHTVIKEHWKNFPAGTKTEDIKKWLKNEYNVTIENNEKPDSPD